MDSVGEAGESLDFDFFDTPGRGESPSVSPKPPVSKPPVRPTTAKPVSTNSKSEGHQSQDNIKSRRARSPSRSVSSDSSPEYSSDYNSSDSESSRDRSRKQKKDRRRQPVDSSHSSSLSRSPSLSESDKSWSKSPPDRRPKRRIHKERKSRSASSSRSSSRSVSGERPSNPVAKADDRQLPKRGKSRQGEDVYSSSAFSDGSEPEETRGAARCDDDGDHRRYKESAMERGKKQAWSEKSSSGRPADLKSHKRMSSTKSANSNSNVKGRGKKNDSDTLSDSDITDVSPMESPRNAFQGKGKKPSHPHMSAAGDGGSVRMQYKAMPVTEKDLEDVQDDYDYNQPSGLDLEILMKAVGELEKQKRLKANSRRVMFAPMTLKRAEKGNYTFSDLQSRNIEKENQRLLKEIVRQVNSTDQRKKYVRERAPASYKMTPSAVNREREIKRIETENLAFLKRLQKVKPTKTISRDNQLKAYESTTLHGVPIAALHPMPTAGGRSGSRCPSVYDDTASSLGSRTRSMTSIHSATSSVRSMGTRRSSRPGSATKTRPGSATKRIDNRPQWSDRW